MNIVVRSTGRGADTYLSTVEGAHRQALEDAGILGCDPPSLQSFVELLEEGREWRMVGSSVTVSYRVVPVGP